MDEVPTIPQIDFYGSDKYDKTFRTKYALHRRNRYSEEFHVAKDSRPFYKRLFAHRTPIEICYTVLYYITFYLVLLGVSTICVYVFYQGLDKYTPRHPKQPGLCFSPVDNQDSGLLEIKFNEKAFSDYDEYIDSINKFLYKYSDFQGYDPCTRPNFYGYPNATPCIFVKVNRVVGFKLETISDVSDFPVEAPLDLKNKVKALSPKERQQRVWISCKTNNKQVQMNYYPVFYVNAADVTIDFKKQLYKEKNEYERSFFDSSDNSRIIAVQFSNLPRKPVHVSCYAWAKNIIIDESGFIGKGMIHFTIDLMNEHAEKFKPAAEI